MSQAPSRDTSHSTSNLHKMIAVKDKIVWEMGHYVH